MIKKIAMLLPDLGGGGAERVFLLLAKKFADAGIRVDLILMKKQGEYLSEVPGNVRVIPLCPGGGGKLNLWEVGIAFIRMILYLNRTSIDVLLSTLSRTNLFAIVSTLITLNKCRVVIREANTFDNISNKFLLGLMARLYPKANHIIAISKGVAKDVLSFNRVEKKNVSVIYNPIDIDRTQILSKKKIEHPWFALKKVPVVVAVGRLAPQKDFETLIQAFSKAQEKIDARLMIIGEGPLRGRLKGKIQNLGIEKKVELAGFKGNPFPYFHHADLFVMSSKWEGFGMVLIEALACGTNVVSTDCHSGPAEILGNGKYGRLVPIGDSDRLSEEMITALTHPLKRELLVDRARQFSKEKICRRYIQELWP